MFPLIHGNAENIPLPDNTFDVAISEYGASGWCDPTLWIPEAARLLRASSGSTGPMGARTPATDRADDQAAPRLRLPDR